MTDIGWHAGQPKGSAVWNGRAGANFPNSRDKAEAPQGAQQQLDRARAQHLRRKLQRFAKHRIQDGEHARPEAYADQIRARAHTPKPFAPRLAPKPAPATSKPSVGGMALLAMIPLAMAGLFYAGYQGGRIATVYLDDDAGGSGVLLNEAAAVVKSTEVVPTEVVPLVPAPQPLDGAISEQPVVAVSPDQAPATASVSASLVETAEAKALLPATVLPEPVAPPIASVAPIAPAAEPPKEAPAEPVVPALAQAANLIGEGQRLLAKGEVVSARELFTKSLQFGLPEAALALGRSYDPQYLVQLPQSDASPDAAMAGKMYRQWYREAVAAGTVAEGVQFERLLHAMKAQ